MDGGSHHVACATVVDPRFASLTRALDADMAALRWFRAPGRVNLIGDHTDYQDGFCLPMAIDRDVLVASRPRTTGEIVVQSLDVSGTAHIGLDGTTGDVHWGAAVAQLAKVLIERGHRLDRAADLAIASTVPIGSGLSSSAAFFVGVALALTDASGAALGDRELALTAQAAEQRATGVPCGVMDQMASVFGRAGHALLLDCRSLEVEPIVLPAGTAVLVVHSGLPRALASSEYAQRRAACEAAAARIGVATLRDAQPEQVASEPIARHVVSENARALAFAAALRAGDSTVLGPLMLESHASLRDDFAVSTPDLDILVQCFVDAGAYGARLTGAGFGGCVVALAPAETAEAVLTDATARYRAATDLEPVPFAVHAVDGAGRIESPGGPTP